MTAGVAKRIAVAAGLIVMVALAFQSFTASVASPQTAAGVPSPPRYAVVIVLDGGRPGYFNLAAMPNLRKLMKRGVTYSQAFVGQEPANTPPSHATIGTGVFPRHHGVEGFLWEDPRTHRMYVPTETGAVESGQLEAVIRHHHPPTLAGQIKATFPRAKIGSVAAHKCYASDAMGTPSADYILCALIYHNRWVAQAIGNHRPPPGAINNHCWDVVIPPRTAGFGPAVQQWWRGAENAWTVRYAMWLFHRVHYPRVLMLNLSETDVLGHFAPNASIIPYLMREFDYLLGQIVSAYRQAGLLSQTDFVITADHGMSRIHQYLPFTAISGAIAQAGATQVFVEHDTAGLIGIVQNRLAPAVAKNVFRLSNGLVDATYYKTHRNHHWQYQLAGARSGISDAVLHAYVTLADTMAADSGPNIFAVYAPHVSSRNFAAFGYPWVAGHLGPQWDDQHIPLVMAGPGLKQGVGSTYPARLVDIAPTVETLLGARTGKVDGVVLQDALTAPSSRRAAIQQQRGATLLPIVRALRSRSNE